MSNELNICHVSLGHHPLDDRIYYKECLSLAKKYSNITLVAPNKGSICESSNIKFSLFKETKYFQNIKTAYLVAKEHDANIYHIHEFELLPLFLWLKIRYGKKIIYDAHESVYHYFLAFSRRPFWLIWPIAVIAHLVERICSAFVNRIITVSPWLVDSFKNYNKKVSLICNFPLLEHFETKSFDKGINPIILYTGQISPSRNIDLIVESMKEVKKKFPNAKLLLIGNSICWFKGQLLGIIEKNNLENNVKIKAAIPYNQIPQLMKSVSIGMGAMAPNKFLKPAIQVKVFEYMLCKLPVISARVPSTELFVEQNKCGILIDDVSKNSIADGIIRILENPGLATEMGENGYQAVQQKYNWQKMEDELLQIYSEVSE